MKTTCEFRFGFWDVTARGDADLAVSDKQPFSDVTAINAENAATPLDIATLEQNFGWTLDGTKDILPDNPASLSWGWWSASMAGKDGRFAVPPHLIVTFTEDDGVTPTVHASAGITMEFYRSLPSTVDIAWFSADNTLLATGSFAPNKTKCFFEKSVADYAKVEITIQSMAQACRFLRVTHILFGALEIIDEKRAVRAQLTEEADVSGLTVPVDMLELGFYTPDGRFSLLNPSGVYQMFQQKQEIEIYRTVDGVQQFMGLHYLAEAAGTEDAVTQLSCTNAIGILDKQEYMGGIYADTSVRTVLDDLFGGDGIAYELDPCYAGVTLTGWLPIGSKRNALQQIAFAIGAVVIMARRRSILLQPAARAVSHTILPARKIVGHKVKMDDLVTQVDVTAHSYVLGAEMKELAKTELTDGTHTIRFTSGPVQVQSVAGAELVESGANYCVVRVASGGEVVVSGYEYADTATVFAAKMESLPANVLSAAKAVSKATLVHSGSAQDVAKRLFDYYQDRYTDEGQVLPGDENVGELVCVSSLSGQQMTGHVRRVVTDLYGGSLQTVAVKGR